MERICGTCEQLCPVVLSAASHKPRRDGSSLPMDIASEDPPDLVRLIPDSNDLKGTWTAVWRLRIAGRNADGPVELECEIAVDLAALNDDIAGDSHWVTSATVLR